jgi:tRNA pseudouridine38-40 synthase
MKLVFSYDGSSFFGLQKQPGKRTIQGVLEHVLRKVDVAPIAVVSSGRTDAGVHALAQVAHFDVERASMRAENFYHIFSRQLPTDIAVISVSEVPTSFHARFSVTSKEYWYKFRSLKESHPNPFASRYYTYVADAIDLARLNEIAAHYVGTHDFTAFTTMPAGFDCVRQIYAAYCEYDAVEETYIFKIKGNGFTKYMVRILVGFMFEIYRGREDITTIESLYASRDRLYVHTKMSPAGLYLVDVAYGEEKASTQEESCTFI